MTKNFDSGGASEVRNPGDFTICLSLCSVSLATDVMNGH